MPNLPSIPLLVGLVCFCGVTTPNFAADEPLNRRSQSFRTLIFRGSLCAASFFRLRPVLAR